MDAPASECRRIFVVRMLLDHTAPACMGTHLHSVSLLSSSSCPFSSTLFHLPALSLPCTEANFFPILNLCLGGFLCFEESVGETLPDMRPETRGSSTF